MNNIFKISKFQILFFCFQLFYIVGNTQNVVSVIPKPLSVEINKKELSFSKAEVSINNASLQEMKKTFESEFSELFSIDFSKKKNNTLIKFKLINSNSNKEGYVLHITKKNIIIEASSQHGIFNGIQTLKQLLYKAQRNNKGAYILANCKIIDEPRFGWRGFMLDESRHFFGKEKVKQLLDLMALHKLNKFHWHLTDEPGWRIEIKKYPKLTSVGGVGNYTDPNAESKFYSQDEIKEIVAYAAKRFIEVIPEIDMPGHASAAVLAYPEHSGGGTENHPNFTFNPGKEETYQFLTDILTEVSTLFSSSYIHIGGDEVHYGNQNWATDISVKKLMKDNHLKNLKDVEKYFVNRMHDSITKLGKKLIGWDEVIHSNVDKNKSLVMWWRHDKRELLDELIEADYSIILCPRIPMYFDFVQHDSLKNGRRWGKSFGTLEDVYNFPDQLGIDFNNDKIKGIQANLWTERYESENSLDFALWPRVTALAEASWVDVKSKNFKTFKERLKEMYPIYNNYGLYYFDFFNPTKKREPKGAGTSKWQLNHINK